MSLVYNTHSYFWRHAEQLAALSGYLTRFQDHTLVPVWCAGCAQGEEAYSLAFLLDSLRIESRILATDIFEDALGKAKAGIYQSSKLEKLPSLHRSRMNLTDEGWVVPDHIRDMVTFKKDDLRSSRVHGPFSIVICRNVLIYFDEEMQSNILAHLCRCLAPNGLLVLGYSESSLLSLDGLQRLDDHGIFTKQKEVVRLKSPSLGPGVCLLSDALSSYARGSLRQAGHLLDASIEEKPHSPIGRYFKAMLDIESGRFKDARKNLRAILDSPGARDPETVNFLNHHGLDVERFMLTVQRVLGRLEHAK